MLGAQQTLVFITLWRVEVNFHGTLDSKKYEKSIAKTVDGEARKDTTPVGYAFCTRFSFETRYAKSYYCTYYTVCLWSRRMSR